jgi:hypothetical protein
MPATLCKAMYLSAVMKVPSSRGSCTSRSHPHFSHASDIHWGGSEPVVMPASFHNRKRRRDPLASAELGPLRIRARFAITLTDKDAGAELVDQQTGVRSRLTTQDRATYGRTPRLSVQSRKAGPYEEPDLPGCATACG